MTESGKVVSLATVKQEFAALHWFCLDSLSSWSNFYFAEPCDTYTVILLENTKHNIFSSPLSSFMQSKFVHDTRLLVLRC